MEHKFTIQKKEEGDTILYCTASSDFPSGIYQRSDIGKAYECLRDVVINRRIGCYSVEILKPEEPECDHDDTYLTPTVIDGKIGRTGGKWKRSIFCPICGKDLR